MNLRLALACLLAIGVGLSISVVSIAKVLVVTASVLVLLWPGARGPADHAAARLYTPWAALAALALLGATLAWTTAPADAALQALAKHGKLILIPLMVLLLRTRREALIALSFFIAMQTVQLLSSWLLVAGVPVPWATSQDALAHATVFSNYLVQSIMTAVLAAVCWHLRAFVAPGWRRWAAVAIAALAMCSTLLVMPGRTGHVVAIVVISLAIGWALPKRWRYAGALAPVVVAALLFAVSHSVRERAEQVVTESVDYLAHAKNQSSSGERLNYWRRSVEAIQERPLHGFGVGSFNAQYNRLDAGRGNPPTFNIKNPHQEFLLWGVEAGIPGMLMLCVLLACLWRDARVGERQCRQAAMSVVAGLVVSCMFNSTLFDAAIGDFFCVAIGLLLALGLRSIPSAANTRLTPA